MVDDKTLFAKRRNDDRRRRNQTCIRCGDTLPIPPFTDSGPDTVNMICVSCGQRHEVRRDVVAYGKEE